MQNGKLVENRYVWTTQRNNKLFNFLPTLILILCRYVCYTYQPTLILILCRYVCYTYQPTLIFFFGRESTHQDRRVFRKWSLLFILHLARELLTRIVTWICLQFTLFWMKSKSTHIQIQIVIIFEFTVCHTVVTLNAKC